MKVVPYFSDKPREHMLGAALKQGVESVGDEYEQRRTQDYGETDEGEYRRYPGPTPDTDVAVFFGVKGQSRQIMEDHLAMGKATIYLDKGITREKGKGHTLYTRAFVNAAHPNNYMMRRKYKPDRFDALRISLRGRRKGHNILFCGSSAKFHEFHRIPPPTEFAAQIYREIRKYTDQPVIYRPKPSWRRAQPIPGTLFSPSSQTLDEALAGAHCMVTYGSGAAFYAICAGVPVISLGPSIAWPVADDAISSIRDPLFARDAERQRWANAVAYTQFTTQEFASGFAWAHLKELIKSGRQTA